MKSWKPCNFKHHSHGIFQYMFKFKINELKWEAPCDNIIKIQLAMLWRPKCRLLDQNGPDGSGVITDNISS